MRRTNQQSSDPAHNAPVPALVPTAPDATVLEQNRKLADAFAADAPQAPAGAVPSAVLQENERIAEAFVNSTPDTPVQQPDAYVATTNQSRKSLDQMVNERLAQRAAASQKREALVRAALKKGRRIPALAAGAPVTGVDETAIVDHDGTPLIGADEYGRWVSLKDLSDRPSASKADHFRSKGFKPVIANDGKPLVSRFGMAMKAPLEAEADRRADWAERVVSPADIRREFEKDVEQGNREYGARVAIPYAPEELESLD